MKLIVTKPLNVRYVCACGESVEVVIGPREEFVSSVAVKKEYEGKVKVWAQEAITQIQHHCGRSEPIIKLILAPMGVEIIE